MSAVLLERLLEPGGLVTWMQPVLSVKPGATGLYSLECLARGPADTNLSSPEVLFDYVRRKRAEQAIDRICVESAVRAGARLKSPCKLNVNVHASTLERDPAFADWIAGLCAEVGLAPTRLTIEIVEHAPAFGGPAFLTRLDQLREKGMEIALDDVGLGQSNFRMILECRPRYLKLDRHFVQGAATDDHRRAVLGSIAYLAQRTGADVVAEGIETMADLRTVAAEGVHLLQGYYFSVPRPADDIEAHLDDVTAKALLAAASLDLGASHLHHPEPKDGGPTMAEKHRILLIDDSRTVRTHLQLLLGIDYECVGAESGEAGLELLRTLSPKPAIVLLDVRMPGLGGLETLRQVKADEALRDIPVVMVTTRGEEETVNAARALGCAGFVTKPVQAAELFGVIRGLGRGE